MKRVLGLAACSAVLLLAGIAWAAQAPAAKRSTYSDAVYGFTLEAPNFPAATQKIPVMPVLLQGPVDGGFASHVNVSVQPATTDRKGYREVSAKQMQQGGLKLNSDKDVTVSGHDAIRFDYEGQLQNQNMHFLSLAVIEKDRVILVTCTAAADAFKAIEPEFNACLDSFKLK